VKKYRVEFTPDAFDDINKIDKATAERILYKITWLAVNYDFLVHESLKGKLNRFCKLRIGHWRVLYSVNHPKKIISIHLIGHRKDIYKS